MLIGRRGRSSIPSSVDGVYGAFVGSVLSTAYGPDATTGMRYIYIKLKRSATGAGSLLGDGNGGVSISVDTGNILSVTNGTDTATIRVENFVDIDDEIVISIEMIQGVDASTLRVGQLLDVDMEYLLLGFDAQASTLNIEHSITGNQYQRGEDGAYTIVSNVPAVDSFDGEKWLRACGSVENLFAASALANDGGVTTEVSVADDGLYKRITKTTNNISKPLPIVTASNPLAISTVVICVKAGNRTGVCLGIFRGAFVAATAKILSGPGTFGSSGVSNLFYVTGLSTTEETIVSITTTVPTPSGILLSLYVYPELWNSANGSGYYVLARNPLFTVGSYPMPYVPPTITQSASKSTPTAGIWFDAETGGDIDTLISSGSFTLAARTMQMLGSSYLLGASDIPIATVNESGANDLITFSHNTTEASSILISSNDGTAPIDTIGTWGHFSIIRRVLQTNMNDLLYRVGYAIEGIHTSIQWSEWKAYDGGFTTSSAARIMLNTSDYPVWYNKVFLFSGVVSDTTIRYALGFDI